MEYTYYLKYEDEKSIWQRSFELEKPDRVLCYPFIAVAISKEFAAQSPP